MTMRMVSVPILWPARRSAERPERWWPPDVVGCAALGAVVGPAAGAAGLAVGYAAGAAGLAVGAAGAPPQAASRAMLGQCRAALRNERRSRERTGFMSMLLLPKMLGNQGQLGRYGPRLSGPKPTARHAQEYRLPGSAKHTHRGRLL